LKTFHPYRPPPPAPPRPFFQGKWNAYWIWSSGTDKELTRFMRKVFEVPGPMREAILVATCDNGYELYLNGKLLGKGDDWYTPETYAVASLLRPGKNVLAVKCVNAAPGAAGLLLELGGTARDGTFVHVISDASWRVSKHAEPGWAGIEFDDSHWARATSVGKQPCAPWATQVRFELPYLGPKQPLVLEQARLPSRIAVGAPFRITATWRVEKPLKHDYPVVLMGRQDNDSFADLCVIEPTTPTTQWQAGREHTESFAMRIGPTAGYFLDSGKIDIALEVRGCYYANRPDARVGSTLFQRSPPAAALELRTPAARATDGFFVDPQGRRHAWRTRDDAIEVDGVDYIPLRGSDGVYYCEAEGARVALASIDSRPVIADIARNGGPSGADFIRVRLVDHVDCSKTDHDFSDDGRLGGKSRVVQIGGRKFRLTSARRRLSYFAYTVTCVHAQDPHLLVFQSVNDRERYTTLRVQPPWDNVGGGVYTGREYPCDGRVFEHGFLFYPRTRAVRFTVSRWPVEEDRDDPLNGAAVSHVWLFELLDTLASRPVATFAPPGRQRRLGMYLTHPAYINRLYGFRGQTERERKASVRGFVDYLRFCGVNLLEFNAVDGGDTTGVAYYPAKMWPHSDANLMAELLAQCRAVGIQVIPIVTSLSVPEGKFGFTADSMLRNRNGKPVFFFRSRPPLPDPLRPEVQQALLDTLKEILETCGKDPTVPAVGFRVNGKIGLCFGGSTLGASDQYTGYSKWDVALFRRETGIAVPDGKPTSYAWIRANCWDRWLRWRCDKTRQFWLRCRDLVRSYRPDLNLMISCDMPSETPAWNIYWPSGTTPLQCMIYHGVDPRLFRNDKGILLQRGMMIAADRYFTYSGQYARNHGAMKAFHYASGVAQMYNGAEGNACELYHNYWEESGVFPQGEFHTSFWGAATMYPLQRYYFEPIAYSLAVTNCHTLNLFSWERGTYGHESDLRAWARAFRAIPVGEGEDASSFVAGGYAAEPPAAPRKDVEPKVYRGGVWARRFGNRLAILNCDDRPVQLTVQFPAVLRRGQNLIEAGRLQILATGPGKAAFELPMKPYELRVLLVR